MRTLIWAAFNKGLLAEQVNDQKVVIDLHNKIKKFHMFRKVCKKEVRPYASVVQKTCAAALAPKVIQKMSEKPMLQIKESATSSFTEWQKRKGGTQDESNACFEAFGRATIVYSTITSRSYRKWKSKACKGLPEQPGQCFYAPEELKVAERDDRVRLYLSQSGQNLWCTGWETKACRRAAEEKK